jgi:SAM-dependent methyltransferase
MNQLLEAYSGDKARNYDARRAASRRWRSEIEAMDAMLDAVRPASVLDCPFGTGRWIEQYEKVGAQVMAVDLSQGMLDEAKAKIAALPETRRSVYRVVCQSIFDLQPPDFGPPDLAVCIRFLNWVNLSDATRALERLTALGSPNMIVGASLVPQGASSLRRLRYRASLALINLRGRKGPPQHVHAEADFMAVLDSLGWRIVDRREIMRRNARVNYFFLLNRA